METPCTSLGAAPPIGLSYVPFHRSVSERGTTFELRQNGAIAYPRGAARRGATRTAAQKRTAENLRCQQQAGIRKGTGFMSRATRSKVMKSAYRILCLGAVPAAQNMRYNVALGYRQQVCYPTLLTLTLPSEQARLADGSPDDGQVQRLVRGFIDGVLRVLCGVRHYVVVYEPQPGTGNLHAHVLCDKFIENLPAGQNKVDAEPLRLTKLWNRRLALAGYIEPYAAKMRARYAAGFFFDESMADTRKERVAGEWQPVAQLVPEARQRERYAYGVATDWQQPNTVDIHALYKADNVGGYIAAYLSKSDGVRPIAAGCRPWAASGGLDKIALYQEDFGPEHRAAIRTLRQRGKLWEALITDAGTCTRQEYEDSGMAEFSVGIRAVVYRFRDADWWAAAPPGYRRRYDAYWRQVLRQQYGEAVLPGRPQLRASRQKVGQAQSVLVVAANQLRPASSLPTPARTTLERPAATAAASGPAVDAQACATALSSPLPQLWPSRAWVGSQPFIDWRGTG